MDSSELPQPARPSSLHLTAELRQLMESAPNIPGVNLSDVKRGDILLFSTQNSLYTFCVETPASRKDKVHCTGELQGGRIDEPTTDVEILGATVTGGALLQDQAKEQMCVEFSVPLKEPDTRGNHFKTVTTSYLRSIKRLEAASIGS